MILKCPRCGEEKENTGNPFRPFCSERCKMLDLGNWMSGSYHIPVVSADEDEDGETTQDKDPDQE
jgi:uncharacterized protein